MDGRAVIPIEWRLIECGHCIHPAASAEKGASWRPCEFPALVSLLRHPREGWILFDTGYGESFANATRSFPESLYPRVTPVSWKPEQSAVSQLWAAGIEPAALGHVVVSHFHGDHVGGLADFPHAPVWCAHDAWEDLHGRARLSALSVGLLPALAPRSRVSQLRFFEHAPAARLPPDLEPFGTGHDLFRDGSIYAIPLPGHAVGHFGLAFRDARRWVFLVGDAAWSTRAVLENIPPPRWATGLLGDTETYRRTLGALHQLCLRRTGVLIVPSHCRSLRP